MSGGLSRRLKSAFIAQATIAVLVIVVGNAWWKSRKES